MKVRTLRAEHVPRVVEIHCRAFPEFFLTSLGPGFLREFYGSFVRSSDGIGLVLEEDTGEVVGFAVGPLHPTGYFRRLLRRRAIPLAAQLCGIVVRRPKAVFRLARRMSEETSEPVGPGHALLSSLAVDVSHHRRGGGSLLLEAFVGEARRRGAAGVFLTTDRFGHDGVNSFYRRNGWTLDCSYSSWAGRQLNRYVYDCSPQDDSSDSDTEETRS